MEKQRRVVTLLGKQWQRMCWLRASTVTVVGGVQVPTKAVVINHDLMTDDKNETGATFHIFSTLVCTIYMYI